jgi:hypothetical protein
MYLPIILTRNYPECTVPITRSTNLPDEYILYYPVQYPDKKSFGYVSKTNREESLMDWYQEAVIGR